MFRCVVNFQTVPNAICFLLAKELDQRMVMMGVQVIHHDIDALCFWMDHIDQITHYKGKVTFGSSLGDEHVAGACLGLDKQEQIARAVSFVLVILSSSLSRFEDSWIGDGSQQLRTFLIKTDQRTPGIVGFLVERQKVFHALDEFWRDFWNAPTSYFPRLEFVFFSSSRTVSGETRVTMPSFNISCTNSSNDQRARPAGGSLQAKAIKRASCSSSISVPVGACGLSSKATGKPASANRKRTRRIVCSLT